MLHEIYNYNKISQQSEIVFNTDCLIKWLMCSTDIDTIVSIIVQYTHSKRRKIDNNRFHILENTIDKKYWFKTLMFTWWTSCSYKQRTTEAVSTSHCFSMIIRSKSRCSTMMNRFFFLFLGESNRSRTFFRCKHMFLNQFFVFFSTENIVSKGFFIQFHCLLQWTKNFSNFAAQQTNRSSQLRAQCWTSQWYMFFFLINYWIWRFDRDAFWCEWCFEGITSLLLLLLLLISIEIFIQHFENTSSSLIIFQVKLTRKTKSNRQTNA